MKNVAIKGIIPPVVTPMNADENINIPELRNQIERQIAGGVHGIFPFGTNGEGYILSLKEKEEILEATIDQVKGRIPVYAGTGCISTRDTIYMSKRAEDVYKRQRLSRLYGPCHHVHMGMVALIMEGSVPAEVLGRDIHSGGDVVAVGAEEIPPRSGIVVAQPFCVLSLQGDDVLSLIHI